MNELATQAANGTNSESDRSSIQDEIDQLTTEIDRVSETTKFNETYLLKGNGKAATVRINAQDAGITGTLTGVGTGTAKFTMATLKTGESINIGAQGYTIGSTSADVKSAIDHTKVSSITINGTEYKLTTGNTDDADNNTYTDTTLKTFISDGDKVVAGTQTYVVMSSTTNGVSDSDASVITSAHAYELIQEELKKASSIGADPGSEAQVGAADTTTSTTQVSFEITEGKVKTTQGLQMGLHVGADADETNKITFNIDTMSSAGLGVQGLNLVDKTGAKATYAIDAIADAIQKVSAQRSSLGAVQNRLEHTINNLDNVVENTTSAESQIRDTDMAETMVEYSKTNILSQAGQSMLAQANQSNQGVLSLLG
jgi:flagellin